MKFDKVLNMIHEADEGMAATRVQDNTSGAVPQSPTETDKENLSPDQNQLEKPDEPVDVTKVRDRLMKDFNEESGNVSSDVSVVLVKVTRNGVESADEFLPVLRVNSKHAMYLDEDYVIDRPLNAVFSKTLQNNLRIMLQNSVEDAEVEQLNTADGLVYFKLKLPEIESQQTQEQV